MMHVTIQQVVETMRVLVSMKIWMGNDWNHTTTTISNMAYQIGTFLRKFF